MEKPKKTTIILSYNPPQKSCKVVGNRGEEVNYFKDPDRIADDLLIYELQEVHARIVHFLIHALGNDLYNSGIIVDEVRHSTVTDFVVELIADIRLNDASVEIIQSYADDTVQGYRVDLPVAMLFPRSRPLS